MYTSIYRVIQSSGHNHDRDHNWDKDRHQSSKKMMKWSISPPNISYCNECKHNSCHLVGLFDILVFWHHKKQEFQFSYSITLKIENDLKEHSIFKELIIFWKFLIVFIFHQSSYFIRFIIFIIAFFEHNFW